MSTRISLLILWLMSVCWLRALGASESITVSIPSGSGGTFTNPAAVGDIREVNVATDNSDITLISGEVKDADGLDWSGSLNFFTCTIHSSNAPLNPKASHEIVIFFTILRWIVGEGLCPPHGQNRAGVQPRPYDETGCRHERLAQSWGSVIASHAEGVAWQSEGRTLVFRL